MAKTPASLPPPIAPHTLPSCQEHHVVKVCIALPTRQRGIREAASLQKYASHRSMRTAAASLALMVSLIPFRAQASLGGNVASVEADRAHMQGSVQTRPSALYTVHEIQGTAGTVVREYVSPLGNVFAVGWQGQFAPDLHQILGTYFEQYAAGVKALKASYVGRHPLNLQLPGLVVEKNGHMRTEFGRAYIPEQVPLGVKVEDLW